MLVFIFAADFGNNLPGNPYVARFRTGLGHENKKGEREVPRPHYVAEYFSREPLVDSHNRLRHCSGVEDNNKTKDGWYRLMCTFFTAVAVDTFFVMRASLPDDHEMKKLSFNETLAQLSHQLIHNTHSGFVFGCGKRSLTAAGLASSSDSQGVQISNPSSRARVQTPLAAVAPALFSLHIRDRISRDDGAVKRQLRCYMCKSVNNIRRDTSYRCVQCDVPLCQLCFNHHRLLSELPGKKAYLETPNESRVVRVVATTTVSEVTKTVLWMPTENVHPAFFRTPLSMTTGMAMMQPIPRTGVHAASSPAKRQLQASREPALVTPLRPSQQSDGEPVHAHRPLSRPRSISVRQLVQNIVFDYAPAPAPAPAPVVVVAPVPAAFVGHVPDPAPVQAQATVARSIPSADPRVASLAPVARTLAVVTSPPAVTSATFFPPSAAIMISNQSTGAVSKRFRTDVAENL